MHINWLLKNKRIVLVMGRVHGLVLESGYSSTIPWNRVQCNGPGYPGPKKRFLGRENKGIRRCFMRTRRKFMLGPGSRNRFVHDKQDPDPLIPIDNYHTI